MELKLRYLKYQIYNTMFIYIYIQLRKKLEICWLHFRSALVRKNVSV